jgi:hypothetical protein
MDHLASAKRSIEHFSSPMQSPDEPERKPRRALRELIWLVYFVAWTCALLMPMPQNSMGAWEWVADHKYVIAKTLHVLAYALLAVLSGALRVPCRFRWILLFVIMVHAPVTELLQLHVEGRTGALSDVGLDHLGIALGLLLTWKWWSDPT